MSSPSLADTSSSGSTGTPALVISAHADERGAREASRWAERAGLPADAAVLSTAPDLETRLARAGRVLVLDPGLLAAWRGFGARADKHERLPLMARLAGRSVPVTWACTAAQAARWAGSRAQSGSAQRPSRS